MADLETGDRLATYPILSFVLFKVSVQSVRTYLETYWVLFAVVAGTIQRMGW